ncbi:MAG: YihY/virulence factor BrkB family protein [Cyanobacteria bacterium Co-bin13]|nr:YihY/virulence factor BrkB family protein [Cyanobacteria bacterium Co-bin13]
MSSFRKARRLLKGTVVEWQSHEVSLLASSLAYSTVFTLAPLAIIVIMIVGAIFGEVAAEEQIVAQLEELVGAEGAGLLGTAIANMRDQSGEGTLQLVLNLGFLAFGASGVFAQIQNSLDRIWDVRPEPGRHIFHFLRKRLLSFAMILVLAFLLLVSTVANTLLVAVVSTLNQQLPGASYLWQVLQRVVSVGGMTAVFALMYTILPDVEIRWKDTLVGALITALLFLVGQFFFGIFLNMANVGSAYGVAGSFLIVITWIFYAANILFIGAAFTKVYARQQGAPIVPSDFAVARSDDSAR